MATSMLSSIEEWIKFLFSGVGLAALSFLGARALKGRSFLRVFCSRGRAAWRVTDVTHTITILDPSGALATMEKDYNIKVLAKNLREIRDSIAPVNQTKILSTENVAYDRRESTRVGSEWQYFKTSRILNRGDEFHYKIIRELRNCYPDKDEYCDIYLYQPTNRMTIILIFPEGRPWTYYHGLVYKGGRSEVTPVQPKEMNFDGSLALTWELHAPKVDTRYRLQWGW